MYNNKIGQEDDFRIHREKIFHDQRFVDDTIRSKKVGRFYILSKSIKDQYHSFLLQNCQDKRIIEYGCGTDIFAFCLAQNGAKVVTGIDISSTAINIANAQAIEKKMASNLSFELMNAEDLKFDNNSIDIIFGSGILHHLDIEKAMRSIVKVLQPQGKAIFIEPLGHNVFINLFRYLTPTIRSEDEHPLLDRDLVLLKNYFGKVEIKYFYLTVLAASLFVGFPGFKILLAGFEFIDQILFQFPFLKKQAWQVLIYLSEPVKQ